MLEKDVLISKVTWKNFGQAAVNRSGREVVEKDPNDVWLCYTYVTRSEKTRHIAHSMKF